MNGKGDKPRKNSNRKSFEKNYSKIKWQETELKKFTKCFLKIVNKLFTYEK